MTEWQYKINAASDPVKTLEFLNFMKDRGYKIFRYERVGDADCKLGRLTEF